MSIFALNRYSLKQNKKWGLKLDEAAKDAEVAAKDAEVAAKDAEEAVKEEDQTQNGDLFD